MLYETMTKEQHERFVKFALAMCHEIYGSEFDNMPRAAQIAFAVAGVFDACNRVEKGEYHV